MTSKDSTTLPVGSGLEVGSRVLYQAPGTGRDTRIEAVIVRMPTLRSDKYIIDVAGEHIECSWFAIDLPPRKMREYNHSRAMFGGLSK